MLEIWKEIEGFENYYEVSNLGNVRGVDRLIPWNGTTRNQKGKMCRLIEDGAGYIRVDLNKNGKRKLKSVHRLVAGAFLPNTENKPEVNHIDGNKKNNILENLEWVTRSENMKHAVDRKLVTHLHDESEKQKKTVFQFDREGNLLNKFESLTEASNKTGVSTAYISQLCTGARMTQDYHAFTFSHYNRAFAEELEE